MWNPRVGGEKITANALRALWPGSPPRGRGKDFMFCGQHLEIRITPAWAGKRYTSFRSFIRFQDHPRMGGEKRLLLGIGCKGLGSPPHGRGKGKSKSQTRCAKRITPAWAGKSIHRAGDGHFSRDHPRMGGEKFHFIFLLFLVIGSPPRRRGKAIAHNPALYERRITPA